MHYFHFFSHKICMLFKQELNQANWIFAQISGLEKKKHALLPFFFTQKLHVIQTRIKSCKMNFCSDFRLRKKKQHESLPFFFTQKLHVIQTRIKSCKMNFCSDFPLRKKKQHASLPFFFTQKLHVIQTRIKSCKLEFFF